MLDPVHSNSILLPPLLAASGQKKASMAAKCDGKSFLLPMFVGFETGPRVGLCLHGGHMLTRWWHFGTTFGHAASTAAVCKPLDLPVDAIEDALRIYTTMRAHISSVCQ
jgi:aconitate decarboxylase